MDLDKAWGLSIDPNTHDTGLIEWHGREPAGRWTIEADRWLEMSKLICGWIVPQDTGISEYNWIACEGVYSGPNARTFGELSRLVGTIEGHCCWHGIAYVELSVAEINAAIGLAPRLTSAKRKAALMAYAAPRLADLAGGWAELTQHEADAYAVGVAALRELERRELGSK